jgi:hypothetical protein
LQGRGYTQLFALGGHIFLEEPDQARQWLSQAKAVVGETWIGYQAQRMLDYYFP